MKEDFLHRKLDERHAQNAFRYLRLPGDTVDLCSNDYLGIATNKLIDTALAGTTVRLRHGSGGSRLLAGNYALIEEVEGEIADFHDAHAGLIFNSGYDANLGLLSCVPQRGDTILYDQLSHASLRDGIRLSFGRSFSFLHNDLQDLEKKMQQATGNIFIVTESVFSMDGDIAPLSAIAQLCRQYGAYLVVDEAHATGIAGPRGEGVVQELGLTGACFARIHTFGKAVGCHGAVVLGSRALKDYLINFARPFIYTTALPESSIMAIRMAYGLFPGMEQERSRLQQLIHRFRTASMPYQMLESTTPIQGVIIRGNIKVKAVATALQQAGLDVRAILYPTVPMDSERLRIVIHAFNKEEEMTRLIEILNRPT